MNDPTSLVRQSLSRSILRHPDGCKNRQSNLFQTLERSAYKAGRSIELDEYLRPRACTFTKSYDHADEGRYHTGGQDYDLHVNRLRNSSFASSQAIGVS